MNDEDSLLQRILQDFYQNRSIERIPNYDMNAPIYTDSYTLPEMFKGFGQRMDNDMQRFPDSDQGLQELINRMKANKRYSM